MRALLNINGTEFAYNTTANSELKEIRDDFNHTNHKTFLEKWYTKFTKIKFKEEDFPWHSGITLDPKKMSLDLKIEKAEGNSITTYSSDGDILRIRKR